MKYDLQKYFLNFPVTHLTADASPTKLCLEFSSGDTIDLKMNEIGHRRIISRHLKNSHFPLSFYCASDFLVSDDSSYWKISAPIQ